MMVGGRARYQYPPAGSELAVTPLPPSTRSIPSPSSLKWRLYSAGGASSTTNSARMRTRHVPETREHFNRITVIQNT